MIVDRFTFTAKPGRRREMVELLKAEGERAGIEGGVYTFLYGAVDVVIADATFESEEEGKKFWADRNTQPEAQEFSERLEELRESGQIYEQLILH